MTKRNGRLFLPQVIDKWGGIENWLSGNRDGLRHGGNRYPLFYGTSRPSIVCFWIMRRLAKSGTRAVSDANNFLAKVCRRYSERPERTYEANKLEGFGKLVLCAQGRPSESIPLWVARCATADAAEEAQKQGVAHSDMGTRMLWRAGGNKYEELKECRWCGAYVQFKEHWKQYDGSVRCNSRDCRRIDYLRNTPQSRGGIDLTPNQRRALDPEAWNTQKVINYLALVAKEQKRGRKSNHDVR